MAKDRWGGLLSSKHELGLDVWTIMGWCAILNTAYGSASADASQ